MVAVTVVGAGVAGLCVATELAERGARVRLVDAGGGPGPHACSWWAGGMLAPFCEGETAEEPVVRLGRQAADWWERQGAGVTRAGTLVVAPGRDRRELDRFARRTQGHETLDAERIAEVEPDLAGRFGRALFFAEESHVDPRAALATLVDSLSRQGAEVSAARARLPGARRAPTGDGDAAAADVPVLRLDPPADPDRVVDCRGLSARDALPDLRGVKGEMVVLRCPEVSLGRPVRLLHPRSPLYIVPRGDGVYMLGATVIEATERRRATARSLVELLGAAYALHPAFAEAEVLEIGVDARPAFPDNLPRIRRHGRVVHANGLYRHGFLLGPALAVQVADLVLDGTKPELMDEDHAERGAA